MYEKFRLVYVFIVLSVVVMSFYNSVLGTGNYSDSDTDSVISFHSHWWRCDNDQKWKNVAWVSFTCFVFKLFPGVTWIKKKLDDGYELFYGFSQGAGIWWRHTKNVKFGLWLFEHRSFEFFIYGIFRSQIEHKPVWKSWVFPLFLSLSFSVFGVKYKFIRLTFLSIMDIVRILSRGKNEDDKLESPWYTTKDVFYSSYVACIIFSLLPRVSIDVSWFNRKKIKTEEVYD